MKRTVSVFALIVLFVGLLDGVVAVTLNWAERTGRLGSLVQYFEYGRSVPGKLERWQEAPGTPGNLFDVAWRDEITAQSAAAFADEPGGPVMRSYGMSFVNRILAQAVELNPDLVWDGHSGPGAPPNFTYAVFEDDRANRRAGDIAVLGILSSALPAMAALSNRTWAFEQPAPFTYPRYGLNGDGLSRTEPVVTSAAQQRGLSAQQARAWEAQLADHDAFYAWTTFGASWLDVSPFARLVRRTLAKSHVDGVKADVFSEAAYPTTEVLRRMVTGFAQTARTDNQRPIVMLIQSRDARDPDLLELLRPVLEADDIPYLATIEHANPRDPSAFLSDGHYTHAVDRRFAEAFLEVIQ